jgi:dipeptidyl aminopeptidase/acylaminoacyl peptidase
VPIGESIQLFNALKILGKTVEFVQVDGEDHYIADYKMRSQWHDTIMAWFARWLQDSPQWWEDLYKERHW